MFLFQALLLLTVSGFCCAQSCYTTDSTTYRHYSTKTKYSEVKGSLKSDAACTPVFLYLYSRDGIRFPSDDDHEEWKKFLLDDAKSNSSSAGNAALCDEDKNAIKLWNLRWKEGDGKKLTPTGQQEAKDLAKSFKKEFGALFEQAFSSSLYEILHSSEDNPKATASAFAEQLFGNASDVATNNSLTRFYKDCKAYEVVDDGDVLEYDNFGKSALFNETLDRVKARLGRTSLSHEQLEIVYDACRYEWAIYEDAPWCAAFNTADLKVLEYWEDIEKYWTNGFAHPITYEQGCVVVKDLVDHIRAAANGTSSLKMAARFGHDTSISSFTSRLGLFDDTRNLTADMYSAAANRKWKTSENQPFGANIAFLLYNCSVGGLKVQIFSNEKKMALPGCGNANGCALEKFIEKLSPIASDCDFDKLCAGGVTPPPDGASGLFVNAGTFVAVLIAALLLK